jgi:hypothetical protein
MDFAVRPLMTAWPKTSDRISKLVWEKRGRRLCDREISNNTSHECQEGARVDAKPKSAGRRSHGWGIFFANAKKEFPAAAEILKQARR